MIRILYCLILICFQVGLSAQKSPVKLTPSDVRIGESNVRKKLVEKSIVNNVKFRSIGPTIMSGRVVDVDINEKNPIEFYVAYASGGLWKTTNNGHSFTPIFDNEISMTIGDIAVDWKNGETIWIGTGENNSSRSSYSGTGIYKSSDKGKSWQWLSLAETHHIGRIVLHPTDPNTLWVAALGHLYSPNEERGVYKTTDGGKTWKKTLFVNENAGAIDLIVDPKNPKILYTATWERTRRAWHFEGSGEGSGIYKSEDGGESWNLVTNLKSGFPTGRGVGRIGLAISHQNSDLLYAILDNQDREAKEQDSSLTKDELRTITVEGFSKLSDKQLSTFLSTNGFPKKYTSEKIKKMVSEGEIKPIALVEYLEDANSLLFDTPVKGAQLYVSKDGGKSWTKTHEGNIDDIFYTYGYYFGQISVDPSNDQILYIPAFNILKSEDGGKTFKNIAKENVHADHHAFWINSMNPNHIIDGNDGGINITYDAGENWIKANTPAVGQFYTVNYDMAKSYNVYGGLQDNGVWVGSSRSKMNNAWHQSGKNPFQHIMGGDGMQVEIDSRDNNTIYTGYQFGNYFKIDKAKDDGNPLKIKHDLGERPYRFNWQTPIHLSKHNEDIIYFGSNKFHRSLDKGENFEALSEDLTKGGKKGNVAYGTLTSIDESPKQFGLIYVGSDDGLVHISKDGGNKWANISKGLPSDLWVSRVTASSHDKNTVYVSLNGYRWDNFESHIYASKNNGKKWERIGLGLPAEPVNVIKDDPKNENILYVGTDHGLYVSLDKGATFMAMNNELPAVAVHDLVIHPRENDLIVGTHGRSIYIANVEHIQQLDKKLLEKELYVFSIDETKYNPSWGNSWNKWNAPSEPEVEIAYYAKSKGIAEINISLDSLSLKGLKDTCEIGLNIINYNLVFDTTYIKAYQDLLKKDDKSETKVEVAKNGKAYLRKATYNVSVSINGKEEKVQLIVK